MLVSAEADERAVCRVGLFERFYRQAAGRVVPDGRGVVLGDDDEVALNVELLHAVGCKQARRPRIGDVRSVDAEPRDEVRGIGVVADGEVATTPLNAAWLAHLFDRFLSRMRPTKRFLPLRSSTSPKGPYLGRPSTNRLPLSS